MKEIKKSASFKSKQKGKDVKFNIDLNYSPEYDSFIIKIKEGEGFMSYTSSIERMPLEVIKKLNNMLEEVLVQADSEYNTKKFDDDYADIGQFSLPDSEWNKTEQEYIKLGKEVVKTKFNGDLEKAYDYVVRKKREFGGDFQSGVYAGGGSINEYVLIEGTTRYDGSKVSFLVSKKELNKIPYQTMEEKAKSFVDNVTDWYGENSYGYKKLITDKKLISDYAKGYNHSNYKVILSDDEDNYPEGFYVRKSKDYLKFEFGGDFQSGVYAKGGSLEAHGIEVGDTFLTTISGNIQKVKDKNGKIVYVDLSNGKRDTQPPLPFDNGGMVSEDLFENYNKQPKELAEIVDFYMAKYDEGEMDYQDTKNFLKKVEAIGYTFDYDLDNMPYGLRPIGTELKSYDNGGEVKYYINKDGIKVRSKVEPKTKLSEAEWMAKHNASKEARTYGFGGLFSKSAIMSRPKSIDLNQEQVRLKSGEYVQVLNQQGDTLMVMDLNKLGTGTAPKYVKLSDVDMTSFKNGGALIGNQKRIDMNKNGKIDAEDFKLLRSSMNGAWRKEHKYVNSTSRKDGKVIDYEVRYAKKNNPARTGYKGKRKFEEGGQIESAIKGYKEFTKKNWEGYDYFSEKYAVNELAELELDLRKLNDGKLAPSKVVGGGYKNAKKVAQEWLQSQIEKQKLAIKTNGISNTTNHRNFRSYLVDAKRENIISESKFNELLDESNEIMDSVLKSFANGGGISNLDFRNFTLNDFIQNLPADVSFMYISKKNSTDKIRISDKEFKNFKLKHFTITDYGNMELSRGSENLYLDIMVYEASKETPEVQYTISIYTKDNHKGLKLFANNLVEKFAGGGGINYGIPKEDLENYNIIEVIEKEVTIDYNNKEEKSKCIILAKPISNNYKNKFYEPKVFIVTKNNSIYTISNVKSIKWNEIKKDVNKNSLTYNRYGYSKILLKGGGVNKNIEIKNFADLKQGDVIRRKDKLGTSIFVVMKSPIQNRFYKNEYDAYVTCIVSNTDFYKPNQEYNITSIVKYGKLGNVDYIGKWNYDDEIDYSTYLPKSNRKFEGGGGVSTAERFKKVLAKHNKSNQVKPKNQKQNVKTGTTEKKGNRGGVMVLAKKIRKEGESWKDALKRAGQQLK